MFAALGGAGAFAAMAVNVTAADAAVGRLSRSTRLSPSTISAWQGAAQIFGSTAEGMAQSFVKITDAVEGWKIGDVSPLIAQFREISTAGGTVIDINKGVDKTLLDLADNFKAIHDKNPATAGLLGRRAGFDPGMIDMLIRGSAEVQKMLDKVKAFGTATNESTESAGDLARAWNEVNLALTGKARSAITGQTSAGISIVGALATMLDTVSKDVSTPSKFVGLDKIKSTSWQEWWDLLTLKGSHTSAPSTPAALPQRGAFKSNPDRVAFIRSEAVRQGQSPDVWERLFAGEGRAGYAGDYDATGKPTSFGAFQLHYPGVGRNTADGLGTAFTKETGLDARDPNTEPQQIAWSMRYARTHGLSAWHGWHGSQWGNLQGSAGEGGAGTVINNNTTTVGDVSINVPAGSDGAQIARDFRKELIERQSNVSQADYGQN